MCVTVLKESTPTARVDHDCMASDFILNQGIDGFGYTFSEFRAIAKAKKSNFKILKGDKYMKQTNKQHGDIYTFKAIPAMHDICVKYDLYDQ